MLFIAKYYIIKNFYALSRYLYKHNKRFTKELFRTNVCILIFISKKKKKRSSKRIQQKNRFASTFRDGDSRKVIRTLERAGANGSSLDTRENYRI